MNNDWIIKNKQIANSKNYGLIDIMIKNLANYIDFNNINTIYDVGSRDMLQTFEFLSVFPMANIHSFEPNPDAIIVCEENIKIYLEKNPDKIKNINFHKLAISDVNGIFPFYASDLEKSYDKNIGVSSLLKLKPQTPNNWHWVQKKVNVECITFERFISNGNPIPDIAWIDIQGHELAALKSMGNYIGNVKAIFTEAGKIAYYEGHNMHDEIDQYLTSFGFKLILEVPGHEYESDFLYIK